MMKNMEWGATVYLSHSKYGMCSNGTCSEVWMNNTQTGATGTSSITGCSGASVSAGIKTNMTACEIDREYKKTGVKYSTTGAIYGVYDMSGGVWERVMASATDENGNFITNSSAFSNSPDSKDWDKYGYNIDNTNYSITKLGDAIKEVRKGTSGLNQGWYNDYSSIPYTSNPWFYRGSGAFSGSSDGIFGVDGATGNAHSAYGSRVVLTFIK